MKGVTGKEVKLPLVQLKMKSRFPDSEFFVCLSDELPSRINLLIGNDIWSYTSLVVTCSMATNEINSAINSDILQPLASHTNANNVNTFETNYSHVDTNVNNNDDDVDNMCLNKLFDTNCPNDNGVNDVISVNDDLLFDSVDRNMLIDLQRTDITLSKLFDRIVDEESDRVTFFLCDGVLFRKWRDPRISPEVDEHTVQIIVLRCLRVKLLHIAHKLIELQHCDST